MFLHVTRASHISDYRVWLEFNDGTQGEVDLSSELWGEVFEPLKAPEEFRTFEVDSELSTIAWSNGADFAPEFLRDLLEQQAGDALAKKSA